VLAAAIVIGLLFWLRRATQPLVVGGIGLVIGGAIGNVIDRLRFGAVVDFLDFHVAGWHWPAFNVADAAICVGVGLILIDSLLGRREMPNKVA
jgi:signal peptidase II